MDNGKLIMENEIKMDHQQAIQDKSFHFAVRIVNLCRYLRDGQKEYILSKQLMRSGTSIGANVAEAQQAQIKPDFINKMNVALKEAYETNYWLRLLHATQYLNTKEYESIIADYLEVVKLLVAIVKSAKE